MATNTLGSLVINIEANSKQLIEGFNKAEKVVERTTSNIKTAIGSIATIAIAQKFIETADSITNVNNQLKLVTKSTKEFTTAQTELFKIAQLTRQKYSDTAKTYSDFALSMGEMGKSQKEILRITESVNKAVAISGGTTQQAAAAIQQLGQAFGSGVLAGDELKSILENSKGLAKAIADGMGVPIGKLKQLGSEGKITAEVLAAALEKSAKDIDEKFNKMTITFAQSWTKITNTLGNAIGKFDEASGITSILSKSISDLSGYIDTVDFQGLAEIIPILQGIATAMGVLYTASKAAAITESGLAIIRAKNAAELAIQTKILEHKTRMEIADAEAMALGTYAITARTLATEAQIVAMQTHSVFAIQQAKLLATEAASAEAAAIAQTAHARALAATSTAMATTSISATIMATAIKAIPFVAVAATVALLATSFFDASKDANTLTNALSATNDELEKLTENQLKLNKLSLSKAYTDSAEELSKAVNERRFFKGDKNSEEFIALKAYEDTLRQKHKDILKQIELTNKVIDKSTKAVEISPTKKLNTAALDAEKLKIEEEFYKKAAKLGADAFENEKKAAEKAKEDGIKLKKEAQDAENDLAKEGFKIQQEFLDKNHKENQKAIAVINEKTKQQQSDNEAFLKIIESETDKINNEYLKIYETQKLIASPEQLEAFYKKWQSEIDNIKPPKDDFQKWGDTLNSSISNALVDALKDGDVMGAVKGLGASISASMIQASTSNIVSGKGDLLSMAGLGGIAAGVGISAVSNLFGGSKKSNEQKAQEAFDKFIKGLGDSTVALDAIGNVGSSTGKQIAGIQSEMNKLIDILNTKYNTGFTLDTNFSEVQGQSSGVKKLGKLQAEINSIALDGLAKSLDYSKLSAEEIDGIIASLSSKNVDFSIKKYEDLKKELEGFALAAKANNGVITNATRVQQILSDEIYKTGQNYESAINLKIKADEDAIASNQALLDANQALSDARNNERLSLQQQIDLLTGATTQRAIELAKIDEANRPLQDRIWLLQDEAETAKLVISIKDRAKETEVNALKDLEDANKNYISALNTQSDVLSKSLSDVTSNISLMTSAFDKIKNTVTSLRSSTKTAEESLQDFYTSMAKTKALSSGTDYEAYSKSLDETISAVSFLTNQDPSNITRDMRFNQLVAANQFEELGIINLTQTDYLRLIEENTRNQIDAILQVVTAMGVSTAISNSSILAASQEAARAAASATTAANASAAISAAAISNPAALQQFTSQNYGNDVVTYALGTNVGATDKTSGFTSVAEIYQKVLGRQPDAAGLAYYNEVLSRGASIQDIASGISQSSEAQIKGVHSFAVGTPNVPYDMYAKIHQGEIITPKNYSDGIRSGDIMMGDTSKMIESMSKLYLEMEKNNRYLSKIEYNTTKSRTEGVA